MSSGGSLLNETRSSSGIDAVTWPSSKVIVIPDGVDNGTSVFRTQFRRSLSEYSWARCFIFPFVMILTQILLKNYQPVNEKE